MKKLILISMLFAFVSFANSKVEPLQVQVQSRTIQADKVSVKKSMAQKQIPAPTRHQTVVTKNADGTFSYQCKQKHNHALDTNKVKK